MLYAVTALTSIGFFPFVLYDTDWMGKEVCRGDPMGDSVQVKLYDEGVRAGSMALMLYVVITGAASLYMEPLVSLCESTRRICGIGDFILAFGMVLTIVITELAKNARNGVATTDLPPPPEITFSALHCSPCWVYQ